MHVTLSVCATEHVQLLKLIQYLVHYKGVCTIQGCVVYSRARSMVLWLLYLIDYCHAFKFKIYDPVTEFNIDK